MADHRQFGIGVSMDVLSLAEAPVTEVADCIHCGTPFRSSVRTGQFCCSGCEFVYRLIHDQELDRYYDLRGTTTAPVNGLVFQKRDYSWLETLVVAADFSPVAELRLEVQGISCIGCVWLIEKVYLRLPGALSIEVNPVKGEMRLRWTPNNCDIIGFARQIQQFGYLLGPVGEGKMPKGNSFVRRLGLCGAFAMNAMLFSVPRYLGMDESFPLYAWFDRLALVFASLSFCVGGTYFIRRAFDSIRLRLVQIDLPIALGLVAAYVGSIYAWSRGSMTFAYFDFVSTFTFLMLLGRWTQQTALERNRNRLLRAEMRVPSVEIEGRESDAQELVPGKVYSIRSGQLVPVRSKMLSQCATFGLEWINGESEPKIARIGQLISAGASNCSSQTVTLQALEPWSHSLLAPLLSIVPKSLTSGDRVQRFIRRYIVAVLTVAVIGSICWLLAGAPVLAALQVFISVLVVSCPCASGVAVPFLDELTVSRLRKAGVFVREGSVWTRLLKVRKIVFDKTGTLTLETMGLQDPGQLQALSAEEKQLLLFMVNDSLHPVACSLREILLSNGTPLPNCPDPAVEITGFGMELPVSGHLYRLGRSGWSGAVTGDCNFSCDGRVLASFRFREETRSGASEEIRILRERGYEVYIASGDHPEKVSAMGRRLELPSGNCRGRLTPAEKARWLQEMNREDTLMIGDGANDSLAFNESYCTGTPAIDRGLLEQKSDFYFLGRGLEAIRRILEAAVHRRNGIRSILTFTIAYNVFAVAAALAGWMSPVAAAVAMPLSSLVSLGIATQAGRKL